MIRKFIFISGLLVTLCLIGINIYVAQIHKQPLRADSGKLVLPDTDNEFHWVSGSWSFYPGSFVEEKNLLSIDSQSIDISRPWNSHMTSENGIDGYGYGTYHVDIELPDTGNYALYVPWINTAYRLIINGKERATVGNPARQPTEHKPRYNPLMATFHVDESLHTSVTLHVSNFSHRSGGVVNPVMIGTRGVVESTVALLDASGMFIIGAMIVASSIILMLFSPPHKKHQLLYISLLAILIALRSALGTSMIVHRIFLNYSWESSLRFEYMVIPFTVCAFLGFFRHQYPAAFRGIGAQITRYTALLFALGFLIVPLESLATLLDGAYLFIGIAIVFWGIQTLRFRLMKTREDNLIIISSIIFILTGIADIVQLKFGSEHYFPLLFSSIGLMHLVFALIYNYTWQFLKAFGYSKQMAADLELTVQKRTQELEELNNQFYNLAIRDTLTGLWNRTELENRIKGHEKSNKGHERAYSICYLDLDNFKYFNDTYNHNVGDQILIFAGRQLLEVASSNNPVFRIGGDEFLLLLPDEGEKQAVTIAQALIQRLQESNDQLHALIREHTVTEQFNKPSVNLACSVGIAVHVSGELNIGRLIQLADAALIQAKLEGKNRYTVYTDL
ncbi:MAG: GGDEF domain-containing protein [Spirochaetota bacterium]